MILMKILQNFAVYAIIIIFLIIVGKELYSRWEENEIIRKHKLKKMIKDLEKGDK